jgi:hypothetical protein
MAAPKSDPFALGPRIGSGLHRTVYASERYPGRVVKCTNSGDNRAEAALWRGANRSLRRHLARVFAISADGSLLLMERTSPVGRSALLKHRIPNCINYDAHCGNFGYLTDGRIVMHDYANTPSSPRTAGRTKSKPSFV